MKAKYFIMIVLMIIFILMLGIKVNAANIEKDKEYELKQEIEVKVLPLIFSVNKTKISIGNIKVTEIINDWCKIQDSKDTGWVRQNNLKELIEEESNTHAEEGQQPEENETENNQQPEESENTLSKDYEVKEISKTGYVSADGLNVRKEPTTSSEAIHSYSFNAKIKITGEVDGWYRIEINGEEGYVSSKYVSDEKLPESTKRGGIDRTIEEDNTPTQVQEESKETQNVVNATTEKQEEQKSSNNSGVTGAQVVSFAKQYLGYKYVAGGASPSTGFDCSGFTTYVFKHFGISLNRSSKDQIKNGISVNKNNLQQGDILIFNNEANTAIGHVGIYIGNGTFIHAANRKEGVKITSLSLSYYAKRYVGARRVI